MAFIKHLVGNKIQIPGVCIGTMAFYTFLTLPKHKFIIIILSINGTFGMIPKPLDMRLQQMFPQLIHPLPIPLPFGIPLAPTNPMIPVAGIPVTPNLSPFDPPFLTRSSKITSYRSLLSFPSYPPPYPPQGLGILSWLPGLLPPGSTFNILPSSAVYSEMLEKEKRKPIRIHLDKLLDKYEQ